MISAESMTTLAFATSLGIALLTMPLVRRWALARGWVDNPDPRKVHDRPVPRLGGVGLFAAFWAGLLWFVGVAGTNPLLNGLLVGASIVFLTGLCDDLRGISARQKFVGEIVACLAAIAVSGLWVSDLGNLFGFGRIVLPIWFGIPFTVFAVVGVINAVNLIDGLDGLAGWLSLIALTAFGLLGLLDGDGAVVLVCLCLIGAILGFLRYNLRPAHIFMGDAGSLTLGFLLGFLAVHLTQQVEAPVGPMVPVLILALPVCDALRVMVLRKLRGQNPFLADRTHIHHRLLDLGLTPRSAVTLLVLIAAIAAATGIAARYWPDWQLLLIFVSGAMVVTLLVAMPQRAGRATGAHLANAARTGRRAR